MLTGKQLIHTGVRIGSSHDGKHQGFVHVRAGVYWEACHALCPDERRIQTLLLDARYGKTNEHTLVNPANVVWRVERQKEIPCPSVQKCST